MNGYYEQVLEQLRAAGWRLLRAGKGSHQVWCNAEGRGRGIVPFHCKSRHTANKVMRDAGLKHRF